MAGAHTSAASNSQPDDPDFPRPVLEPALVESEARFRALYEHSIDGILLTAPDGAILAANPEACRLLGRTEQEICRLGRSGILDLSDSRQPALLAERAATGKVRGEVIMIRGDGTRFESEFASAVFTDRAGNLRTSLIFRDISQRQAAEEALRQANQQLEERVVERTRALAALLELSRDMAAQPEPAPLLTRILAGLSALISHTGAAIAVFEGEKLVIMAYEGPAPHDEVVGARIRLDSESGYRRVVQTRAPVIIDDIRAETGWADGTWPIWDAPARPGQLAPGMSYVRAWLAAPLIAHGQLIGVLWVDSTRPGCFTPLDTEHALAFASQAAVAVVNARLHRAAQQAAATAERQRLARDLHDSVLQALYGIGLALHSAQTKLEPGQEALHARLEVVQRLAQTALIELRAAIFELRPEALAQNGLTVALERHADVLRAQHELQINLHLGAEPDLPLAVKEALYRIAQEAANNAVRHAGAQCVTLSLANDGSGATLEISDDGAGFDPAQPHPGHLGLHTMRERAEQVGAQLELESAPGQGTRVRVRVKSE